MSFAQSLLRQFCRSSRPEWTADGKLKSGRLLTIADRFGPDIWERLWHKNVIDFGSGYGSDVAALTEHEVLAVGVEHRHDLVQAAKELHPECLYYHTDELASMGAFFDSVVSINSFEHYLQPTEVLASMKKVLKPAGTVLIYFSPPWLHPYGAHCREMTPIPWVQLLFPERAVVSMRREYYSEKPGTRYEEVADGLAKMTIAKFKRCIADSGFEMTSLDLIPIRRLEAVARLAPELFTSAVRAELKMRP